MLNGGGFRSNLPFDRQNSIQTYSFVSDSHFDQNNNERSYMHILIHTQSSVDLCSFISDRWHLVTCMANGVSALLTKLFILWLCSCPHAGLGNAS